MNHHPSIVRLAFLTVVFVLSVPTGLAQNNADQWLRVFTEEQSIIDVNRLSLVLEQDQVLRAQFRTKLVKPEAVPGKSAVKYQTRLDSIQFSVKDRRYRIAESSLLDAADKVVSSYSPTGTSGWKPLWGRTVHRLFNAASQLSPFGNWKVRSYRYASGEPSASDDPTELTSLVGTDIWLSLHSVRVGKENCNSPVFEPKTLTNEEFTLRIGSSIKSLGIPWDRIEAIVLICAAKDTFPSQTIILRLPGNKALMLWDGVFLELERPGNLFLP